MNDMSIGFILGVVRAFAVAALVVVGVPTTACEKENNVYACEMIAVPVEVKP